MKSSLQKKQYNTDCIWKDQRVMYSLFLTAFGAITLSHGIITNKSDHKKIGNILLLLALVSFIFRKTSTMQLYSFFSRPAQQEEKEKKESSITPLSPPSSPLLPRMC